MVTGWLTALYNATLNGSLRTVAIDQESRSVSQCLQQSVDSVQLTQTIPISKFPTWLWPCSSM